MPLIDNEAADRIRMRRAALIKRFILAARALLMPLSPNSRGRRGKADRQGWRRRSAQPQGEAVQGENSGRQGTTTARAPPEGEAARGGDAGRIRKERFHSARHAALLRRLKLRKPEEPPTVESSPLPDRDAQARRDAILKSMATVGRSLVRHLSPISRGRRAAGGKAREKGKASGGRAFQMPKGRYRDAKRQSFVRRLALRRSVVLNAIGRAAAAIIRRQIYVAAYRMRAQLNPFRDWGGAPMRAYRHIVNVQRCVEFSGQVGRTFLRDLRGPRL